MALDSEPVRARGIIVIYTGCDVLLSSPACPAEQKKKKKGKVENNLASLREMDNF